MRFPSDRRTSVAMGDEQDVAESVDEEMVGADAVTSDEVGAFDDAPDRPVGLPFADADVTDESFAERRRERPPKSRGRPRAAFAAGGARGPRRQRPARAGRRRRRPRRTRLIRKWIGAIRSTGSSGVVRGPKSTPNRGASVTGVEHDLVRNLSRWRAWMPSPSPGRFVGSWAKPLTP